MGSASHPLFHTHTWTTACLLQNSEHGQTRPALADQTQFFPFLVGSLHSATDKWEKTERRSESGRRHEETRFLIWWERGRNIDCFGVAALATKSNVQFQMGRTQSFCHFLHLIHSRIQQVNFSWKWNRRNNHLKD